MTYSSCGWESIFVYVIPPWLFLRVQSPAIRWGHSVVCLSSNQLRMGTESFSSILLQPFTSWAMDLIRPLPATKSGHTWIVTWVDRTSKMMVAAAAKEGQISSEALALMTFREICCRFGLPLHLTIDNDVKFVSSLWQSLWNLCGTKLRFTSSYNPQSNPTKRGMPPCRTLPLVSTRT